MKASTFFIILLMLGIGVYLYLNTDIFNPNIPSSQNLNLEKQVFDDLKSQGFTDSYVAINSDDSILIRIDTLINDKLDDLMYSTALDAYQKTEKENIRVEAYSLGEPILALDVKGSELENTDSLVFEDIRPPEFKIESDLSIFDVNVYDVNLDDKIAHIKLEYLADEPGFWREYMAMSLLVVEDAPWVDTVKFEYIGNKTLILTSSSDNILKLYNAEISADDFVSELVIQHASEPATATNGSEQNEPGVCPDTIQEAYNNYMDANNTLMGLMNSGNGDTPEAQEAYSTYKQAKDCYENAASR